MTTTLVPMTMLLLIVAMFGVLGVAARRAIRNERTQRRRLIEPQTPEEAANHLGRITVEKREPIFESGAPSLGGQGIIVTAAGLNPVSRTRSLGNAVVGTKNSGSERRKKDRRKPISVGTTIDDR